MSRIEIVYDEANEKTVFTVTLTDSDHGRVNLDATGRVVLNLPTESDSDILRSLEIIFRRLEQQEARPSRAPVRRWAGIAGWFKLFPPSTPSKEG